MKANAGTLTNFEVLDLLNSRGASNDTTSVIAPISTSEYTRLHVVTLAFKRDLVKLIFFFC